MPIGLLKNKFDVIVIGSATRDVFMQSEGYQVLDSLKFTTGKALAFGLGSKVEIKKIVFTVGGGGANAATTFARQGFHTAAIGVIGNDLNGEELLAQLAGEGVDTQFFLRHDDDHTAYSVILVQEGGERTILSYKGEGQHFDVSKIPFEELHSDWLYLDSLGGHYDLLQGAVEWAARNNVKIATNPGGKELAHGLEKLKPLLKYFSIVGMNQEEAAALTGIDYKHEDKIFALMDDLIGGIFIMNKGPDGVVVSDGQNVYRAGVPDSPVVERTGAGDAFNSGFLAEYIRSGDIPKAIQFATANASSVVTQYGGQAGILAKGDTGSWPLVAVDKQSFADRLAGK